MKMSNEFEVHDFYNHTIEELEEIKEDFMYLCGQAIEYKKSVADIKKCRSLDEWCEKWGHVDDDQALFLAEDYFEGDKNE
tara:strand:+ start:277 stop:516 length:240 start_codon:yes stop_codon:yes gene_type:complete